MVLVERASTAPYALDFVGRCAGGWVRVRWVLEGFDFRGSAGLLAEPYVDMMALPLAISRSHDGFRAF